MFKVLWSNLTACNVVFKRFKKALHFSSVTEPLLWTVTAIGTERSLEEFSDGDSPNAFLELKICVHTHL